VKNGRIVIIIRDRNLSETQWLTDIVAWLIMVRGKEVGVEPCRNGLMFDWYRKPNSRWGASFGRSFRCTVRLL